MLISHRKKFIYTKTVKTASTSVESYFEPYCLPDGDWQFTHARDEYVGNTGIIGYRGNNSQGRTWYPHMPAHEIRENVGHQVWEEYFKFCVIRNPYDKMVSRFSKLDKKLQQLSLKRIIRSSFKRVLGIANPPDYARGDSQVERFRKWVKHGGWVNDKNKYMIDGEICVDYFIRYECLEGDIHEVCCHLDIPFEPERIPTLKTGTRDLDIPLSEYYDRETAEIVAQKYRFEIRHFGYQSPLTE